ncbi:MAG: hypothetical protein RSB66_05460 [Clostridium sp.]
MDCIDNMTPEDLMIVSTIIAIELSRGKTDKEIEIIGSIALAIANLMFISANMYKKNCPNGNSNNSSNVYSTDSDIFNIDPNLRR